MEALRQSGASGVLIGRAALGRPWLLGEVSTALAGRAYRGPSAEMRRSAVLAHLAGSLETYGERLGVLNFRKHLAAYLTNEGFPKPYVSSICTLTSPGSLRDAIGESFAAGTVLQEAA
jgi:tRNA-dihydrouridine synthase